MSEGKRERSRYFNVGDVCPYCGHIIMNTKHTFHKPNSLTCKGRRKALRDSFYIHFPKKTGLKPVKENLKWFLVYLGIPERFWFRCYEVYPKILGLEEGGEK